jgi:LPS export ABC transporter protein LptC
MKTGNRPGPCLIPFFTLLVTACSFNYDTIFQDDNEPNLVMEEVEYTRIVNGNPEIQLRAEKVRQYEAKHTMEMDALSFEQYNAAPEGQKAIPAVNARGQAGRANMETDSGNFSLTGGVAIEVVSEDISIKTEKLSWQDKERLLTAPGTVNIIRSNGTSLKGTGFSADIRKRTWEFESAVEGTVEDEE